MIDLENTAFEFRSVVSFKSLTTLLYLKGKMQKKRITMELQRVINHFNL